MMTAAIKRAGEIARLRQVEAVRRVAERARAVVGDAAVAIEDIRVVLRGGGLVRRWLGDPRLRFLSGDGR